MSAAMTSKNKVMHTCTPWTVVFRSWLMSLIMTFMFEPAKLQMNWARASGSSILRSPLAVRGREAALVMTATRGRASRQGRRSRSSVVFLLLTGRFLLRGNDRKTIVKHTGMTLCAPHYPPRVVSRRPLTRRAEYVAEERDTPVVPATGTGRRHLQKIPATGSFAGRAGRGWRQGTPATAAPGERTDP